ncbi:PIG-L deacetylase family protein [Paenibacillus radicibacter]|uniref:PIG-L deacetylase family protein n=1 Tax=Paenibacillus radicibacter TaxID=2972488 RepID=UPI0021596BD5|nr:PIG-L family deacetylase [Paenibacillus radicibacter]
MSHSISFIYAHPDDETFGCAVLIRQVVDRGGKATLLSATRGDAGKTGRLGDMTKEQLAVVRVGELREACDIMGISEIKHLGYPDGKLSTIDRTELAEKIINFINEHKPEVVVTFPEDGISLHPDHTAIHHATNAAIFSGRCPSVQKYYYNASHPLAQMGHYPNLRIDTEQQWDMKADALKAHKSQAFSVERVFGEHVTFAESYRYESFVLVWERGVEWPGGQEKWVFESLE